MDDLINKIVEESDLSQEEVEEKVKKKVKEFSGLVSDEGAVHLVAKEVGVDLPKVESKQLKIENVIPGMRKVTLKAQVVNIGEINEFDRDDGSSGSVQNITLGDETGTIPLVLWNDQTDLSDKLEEEEAIAIKNYFSKEGLGGRTELRLNDSSKVKRIDSAEVPEVKKDAVPGNYQPANLLEIKDQGTRYKVTGNLLQIYSQNPFFQVCPKCEKKVKEDEGNWECEEHGEIEPKHALVISGILDDGYSNIRCVFFRQVARKILELGEEDLEEEQVKEKAEEAIGKEITVKGRASYNDYFNRLELMVNDVEIPQVENLIKAKLKT